MVEPTEYTKRRKDLESDGRLRRYQRDTFQNDFRNCPPTIPAVRSRLSVALGNLLSTAMETLTATGGNLLQAETCYRWKPATGGNLLQAFSVLSGVWRSVLHRDKGGRRPGRDAFRGGSPRKLSNGRKSVPSQPLKSSKSHNSHTHQPAPFDPYIQHLCLKIDPYIQFVLENDDASENAKNSDHSDKLSPMLPLSLRRRYNPTTAKLPIFNKQLLKTHPLFWLSIIQFVL